jgi:Ca-activated chloride channel family protein
MPRCITSFASPACVLPFLALVAWLLLSPPTVAHAAGLLIADGGLGGALQIKEHDVKVTINNGIAVTTVTQVFHNTENRQVEALYTFPVPRGASVSNFSMWIDGKEMVGEVLEKQKARQIYESYKQRRKDPGLLEQTDYRTFDMRIFPIAPNADQKVQVSYYQELDFDHDWATYVYPLATTTRATTAAAADSRTTGRFALDVQIKSAVPIAAVESPSHPKDFAVAKRDPSYAQASYETRDGNLNRDVVLAFHVARPFSGLDLISNKPKDEDGYFCLTLTAGEELARQHNAVMDYVFVLDVSGSMELDGKLDLSRRSLRAFIDALAAEDRFELLAFNVSPATAFGKLRAADEAAKGDAAKFLEAQAPRGGTVLNPAMTLAYKYAEAAASKRPLNVVILSDGLTEQQERQQLVSLIRQRPEGARVFCIGVGNDVNRALLEQLATDSGGLAAFLSREDNIQRQASGFRRKLMRPVASDLKVEFGGVETYDIEPAHLSNLYHGMPVRLYGRYKGGGKTNVKLTGTILGKPLTTSVEFDLPREPQNSNPEIERMWAWRRVDRLLKEADAGGSRSGVLDEIIRLGEAYSIATEYTSFIVLENDAEVARWQIDRRNALRLARDRQAESALAQRLEKMRSASTDALGPAPVMAAAAQPPELSAAPQATTPQATPSANPSNNNNGTQSRDFHFGGGGGGGAIDPISGSIVLGLGALALKSIRRKGGRR